MLPDANTTCLTRAARLALALAASSFVPAAHADDGWRSSFTIYGWLPGVDAELGVPVDTGTAVSKSNTDILDNLRGALMLSFDTHNGDWGFHGDGDWVKFSNQEGTFRSIGGQHVDAALNTRWDFKGGLITLAGLFLLRGATIGFSRTIAQQPYIGGVKQAIGNDPLQYFFAGDLVGSLDVSFAWWIGLTVVAAIVLTRTRFGNWIFAAGGSPSIATPLRSTSGSWVTDQAGAPSRKARNRLNITCSSTSQPSARPPAEASGSA